MLNFTKTTTIMFLLCFFFVFFVGCFQNSEAAPNSTNSEYVSRSIKGTYFDNVFCHLCNESSIEGLLGNASTYTKFYLFSRSTGVNFTNIVLGDLSSITKSAFSVEKSVKILIHGWLDTPFREFGRSTRDAYLSVQDVNLIYVDWSKLADTVFYTSALAEVVPVGEYIAQFVDWLVEEVGVSMNQVHVIGHSLGGQIAGVVGEHVTAGKIGRISGLDPAGPGFSSSTSGRLDATDAQFVDVIHTCGHWSGYYFPSGHVDFYPNRGMYNQPGCPWDIGGCSHLRVYYLFAESIASSRFVATSCTSWMSYVKGDCVNNTKADMGENVDARAKGTFYLHTAGSSPFALGSENAFLELR